MSSTDSGGEAAECSPPRFENGLLADFETEASEQVWYRFGDGVSLVRSEAADAGPSPHALTVTFEVSDGGAGIGLTLSGTTSDGSACPLNAGQFVGVRFWARGEGPLRVSLGDISDLPVAEGGTCTRAGDSCYDFAGVPVQLRDTWQLVQIPFCRLRPEGWGQSHHALDATRLMTLQLRHQLGSSSHFQIDNLTFYAADATDTGTECSSPCPLEAVPNPGTVAPEQTYLALSKALTLHTFEQPTVRCGSLTRRYLEYRPTRLARASDVPIVFALHGRESNAEGFEDLMTHGSFDELAEQSGAIVVYGNAAPGWQSSANPAYLNNGTWRQGANDDGEVDDVDYLRRVLDDMQRRGSIAGGNPVYLVGHSSGGGMAVEAAIAAPELFRGVAPLFAYVGEAEPAVPALSKGAIDKVLFTYATDDPGLPAGHDELLAHMALSWAGALGIDEDQARQAPIKALANPIVEGSSYTGSEPFALATRNSSITQQDYESIADGPSVRVLRIEHGGHFLPHPTQDTDSELLQRFGFRNQDIRIADALWDFFFGSAAR